MLLHSEDPEPLLITGTRVIKEHLKVSKAWEAYGYEDTIMNGMVHRSPRRQQDHQAYYKSTDTMRSCRSMTSGKRVSIHPRVTECHYDNAERVNADSATSD